MSFSFCPFYKSMLKPGIKNEIRIKIKEIQDNFDLSQLNLYISENDIDLSTINYEDIVQERIIWENIAKLSIDLWRDYDYYRYFVFESRYDDKNYTERLKNLEYIFDEGRWKSQCKPNEDIVLRNVFIYCLYRFMSDEKARNRNIDIKESINCYFCDNNIESCLDRCDQCDASVEEIILQQENIVNSDNEKLLLKKVELKNVEAIICDNLVKTETIMRPLTQELFGDENDIHKLDRPELFNETKEDLINSAEWKCGGCGDYNNYKSVNCEVCGKWYCEYCTKETSCINYVCDSCEKRNVCVNTDADNYIKGTTKESIVYDDYDNRGSCNAWRDDQMDPKGSFKDDNRVASPENMNSITNENNAEDKLSSCLSDKVEIPQNVVYGIWICGGCGFHNDYLSDNCKKCYAVFKIGTWYCEQCTKENSCANDVCDVCEGRNVRVKTDADNPVKGRMEDSFVSSEVGHKSRQDGPELSDGPKQEQWYCELCKLWHVFRVLECSSCHNNRIKCGKWQCQKCTMLNIFSVTICAACNDPINYFEVKQDKPQKKKKGYSKNKPLPVDNKWQCRYLNCKDINPNNDEYCSQCRIYRHFSCKVGEEVKRKTKGVIVSGWICWKCTKFNDLHRDKCSGSGCSRKRYDRIVCIDCSETSDMKTENCSKCGYQFRI